LRSKEEWTTSLIEDLNWLGLKHDIFVKQSDKAEIHSSYIKKMIDSGYAYISKEKVVEVFYKVFNPGELEGKIELEKQS
jgi:glutamyl-tRNA synthetase